MRLAGTLVPYRFQDVVQMPSGTRVRVRTYVWLGRATMCIRELPEAPGARLR